MDVYEPEATNILDGIDDFTDLLRFDVGSRDGSSFKLPFFDDDEVPIPADVQPWPATDLSELANDNSSDSGISSVSVKHEPSSSPEHGFLALPPSPVYSDASHADVTDGVLLTDVVTSLDGPPGKALSANELSPPISPLNDISRRASPLICHFSSSQDEGVIVQQAALPCEAAQDNGQVRLTVFGVGSSAANRAADARVTQVLQSKVKIQPKPGAAVCTPSAVAHTSLLAESSSRQRPSQVDSNPLVVTADEFARLTAQGMLKFHPPTPTTALNSSAIATLVNGRACTGSLIAVAAGIKRPLPSSVSSVPSPGIAESQGDDGDDDSCKAWKKQQRMIKNRESASLSRKRRKEYMSGLEQMLQQCCAENDALKQENDTLRHRIESLQAENDRLKATFPLNKKAATTCLMTLAFLAAFKITSLSPEQPSVASLVPHQVLVDAERGQNVKLARSAVHFGRNLLSIDEDRSWPDGGSARRDVNSSRKGGPAAVPAAVAKSQNAGLMVVQDYDSPLCPTSASGYNRTESQRLANELSGWALRSKIAAKKTKLQPGLLARTRTAGRGGGGGSGSSSSLSGGSHQRRRSSSAPTSAAGGGATALRSARPAYVPAPYAMQLYGGRDSVNGKFFDAIHRRNDTFYVISFRMDHWLLPATAHNKTTRPKMAILVPALPLNESLQRAGETVTMLQIECEVMDTRFLRIDQSIIPLHAAWFPEPATGTGAGSKPPTSAFSPANMTVSRPAGVAAPP